MSAKRKYSLDKDEGRNSQDLHLGKKKHTLDSDEEDSDDDTKADVCESDIEGEEDGVSKVRDEIRITPFNMREELEDGHFDKEGHYHWNKSNEIQDNWLDNIDWVKIEKEKENTVHTTANDLSEENSIDLFNESILYKQLMAYMIEGETVESALQRLGKSRVKMSSVERLRLKKEGISDDSGYKITKFTELANEILTKTGNMDIYQATFEFIKEKAKCTPSTSKESTKSNFSYDMYSDDFNEKEQSHKEKSSQKGITVISKANELFWEFKWKKDDINLQGPYDTKQMLKWSKDGYFKGGVYVRKVGEQTNFYTSNRIDFDLFL